MVLPLLGRNCREGVHHPRFGALGETVAKLAKGVEVVMVPLLKATLALSLSCIRGSVAPRSSLWMLVIS